MRGAFLSLPAACPSSLSATVCCPAPAQFSCCNGETTALLASHCRLAMGVDMSVPCLHLARERHTENARLSFHLADAFDIRVRTPALAYRPSWLSASRSQPARLPQALCQLRESLPDGRSEFNKIFLDVNGSRDTAAVTKLIAIYSEAWGVGAIELIVVKNWRLANLLRASTLSAAVLLDRPLPQPVAAVAVAVGGDVNSSQGDHAVRAVMGAVVLAAVATVAVLMCTGGGSSGRAAQRCVGTRP